MLPIGAALMFNSIHSPLCATKMQAGFRTLSVNVLLSNQVIIMYNDNYYEWAREMLAYDINSKIMLVEGHVGSGDN